MAKKQTGNNDDVLNPLDKDLPAGSVLDSSSSSDSDGINHTEDTDKGIELNSDYSLSATSIPSPNVDENTVSSSENGASETPSSSSDDISTSSILSSDNSSTAINVGDDLSPTLTLDDSTKASVEEIPPLPATVENPEVFLPPKSDDSPEMEEIELSAASEIDRIEAEMEKLEQEIVKSEMESADDEFIPETDDEKKAVAEIERIKAEAKKFRQDASTLEKGIMLPADDSDLIETYVPEYQQVEGAEAPAENEETEDAPKADIKPPEEETEDLQAELDRVYETGVGTGLDEWDREILLPVFENRLRMSKNSLKYAYSKIKNIILSYKGITASVQGPIENFRFNKKIVFRVAIKDTSLQLYSALESEVIDNAIYPHKKAKGEHAKATPTIFNIDSEIALRNAIEIIPLVAAKINAEPKEHHVPVAYAERYPINPNAVLLGQEGKPPIEGQYADDFDYGPISSEIVDGIIEAKFGKDKLAQRKELKGQEVLDDLRQTASTIKGAVALTEPVIYFFDAALNKEGTCEYLNIQQVLNDKFLGKIVPQMFFAVAEGSERIEKFNFLSLEFAVEQCNSYPEIRFVLALSARLLIRDAVFERLIKSANTLHDNLVLAFDCALLESLGTLGLERIRRLRNEANVMIMIDNSENAGMRVLTEYDFEYIRFDSRFYAGDSPRQKSHLEMMTGYAKSQNIKTTSVNVLTLKEAITMADRGVTVIQGPAASEPKRIVTLAIKAAKKLPIGK